MNIHDIVMLCLFTATSALCINIVLITLRAKRIGTVYCYRSCLWLRVCNGRAVSEPHYSQRTCSVCISL